MSRYFESPYAPQYWNSLGYVAYILEPSGATGFGQEWASRHVNTAGRGPAEDIIEGTKKICEEHPFINANKIGCMGASYGGFMTQYLQTQTDIFAAAVSHAGSRRYPQIPTSPSVWTPTSPSRSPTVWPKVTASSGTSSPRG